MAVIRHRRQGFSDCPKVAAPSWSIKAAGNWQPNREKALPFSTAAALDQPWGRITG
jgi:hypothetical protein